MLSSDSGKHGKRSFPKGEYTGNMVFHEHFSNNGTVGPNVGEWIGENFSWTYLFSINVNIGIVVTTLMSLLGEEPKKEIRDLTIVEEKESMELH